MGERASSPVVAAGEVSVIGAEIREARALAPAEVRRVQMPGKCAGVKIGGRRSVPRARRRTRGRSLDTGAAPP
ncbi:hypothetical protein GCM10007904_34680 [Oharaeibacter diazotrophicus]|nr:hypothetical protein GCM10007904_34680 [Oharaeibacter diazotrophicus]